MKVHELKGLQHMHILPLLGSSFFHMHMILVYPLMLNDNLDVYLKTNPAADRRRLVRISHFSQNPKPDVDRLAWSSCQRRSISARARPCPQGPTWSKSSRPCHNA